jgi:hypothetical protein
MAFHITSEMLFSLATDLDGSLEAVDLLPVSALQMGPFQEDKKLLPDHLLRQPRHRSGLYPRGIGETTRLSRLEGFLNLPANDAHTDFTCR